MRLLAALLACVLVGCAAAAAVGQGREGGAPRLFEELPGRGEVAGGPRGLVIRIRVVRVNFEVFRVIRESGGGSLSLNLFEDAEFVATLDSFVEADDGSVTWFGTLDGLENSTVVLTEGSGVVVGSVRAPGLASYRIMYRGEGLHTVREVDEAEFPPCGGGVRAPEPGDRERPPDGSRGTTRDSGSVIDVLVVYTQAARDSAGGTTGIHHLINTAINETNQGYNNSLITPSMRLAGRGMVLYSESGQLATDLPRLRDTGDGYMDEVHSMRDAVGADVVNLLVGDADACGRAYLMQTLSGVFEASAFSVVKLSCATGYYSFGHEIGHNQGCAHDRDNAGSDGGLYDYSFGHRWSGPTGDWRSVMAYEQGGDTRVNHYSNPNVLHDGQPTGVAVGDTAAAHNALTIDNTAYTVANFRQSTVDVVWVDFSHTGTEDGSYDFPFNTVAEGVGDLLAGGTLVVKAGATADTITITKAMTVLAFEGTATIGGSP